MLIVVCGYFLLYQRCSSIRGNLCSGSFDNSFGLFLETSKKNFQNFKLMFCLSLQYFFPPKNGKRTKENFLSVFLRTFTIMVNGHRVKKSKIV